MFCFVLAVRGWKGQYTETEHEGWTETERREQRHKCEGDQRGRDEPGSLEPVWPLPVRGFRSVAGGRTRTGREGKQVACCVGTAVVTQMPAWPQAGVDGLLGCLSGSGLGSDASGPWLLAGTGYTYV